jgi:CheY-like chemotaxis protein
MPLRSVAGREEAVLPLSEHDAAVNQAVALARRAAWHAKQSADLANEAEELLAHAATLPHARDSLAEEARTAARSGGALPLARRVLVVDDDQFVRETFAMTLKLEGYDVVTVRTGEAAVHAAAARPPDLIFLDLHLPDFDGVTLLREFRSVFNNRATPVAIITGDYFLADDVTRELIELGAQLRFKPVWTEDLIALTHSLLHAAPN